ncbi:DUF1449 domain-containing protein [Pannus brasiliensis CCIBt3594]|uniref:DUF1449 domain-containing protein n=1 Tax=Pannus brasiliensis CCIBt3594 TaxID=1427578 RepID=A0AAW9QK65_9CHRO
MLFHPSNAPYWFLFGIGITLFLFVIFSGMGDDDLDLDGEAESPLDILGFLGFGRVPTLLLLALDLSLWGVIGLFFNVVIAILAYPIPRGIFGWGGIVFLVSLFISFGIGSWLARPLGKIFASFGEDVSSERLIGRIGTVTSRAIPYLVEGRLGQGDVMDSAGNLVTISVALPEWATVIPHYGQRILIIDRQQHSYIAIAKDSSDEDKWIDRVHRPE